MLFLSIDVPHLDDEVRDITYLSSERHMKCDSDTAAVDARIVAIGQAPYIVYAQHLEYILDAHTRLHVRAVCESLSVGYFGKRHDSVIAQRVVAMRKMSPESLERKHLAQFELFEPRHIIEYCAVCPIGQV